MASSTPSGLRFLDRVAIVTGGCDGIGRGCVDVLVSHGGKVVVLDINDEIGSTMKAGDTGEIFYIHCDMCKESDIEKAIEMALAKYGHLDCLVNNVGTHQGPKRIDELTVQSFKDLFNINVVSAFTASKYALPHLRKSKGCVINMSSFTASSGLRNSTTYCSTKGAVKSFTKALAVDEAKHGVRVNCIAPGIIQTNLFDVVVPEEMKNDIITAAQMHRLGKPEEIGRVCLFLATDATYMTGAEVKSNGGIDIGIGKINPESVFF